jgi:hypothetical protein
VALTILGVVVLTLGRLFDESSTAWDSGQRRADTMLTGRALLEFIAGEVALATYDPGVAAGNYLERPRDNDVFWVLNSTNAPWEVSYALQPAALQRDLDVSGVSRTDDLLGNLPALRVSALDIDYEPNADPRYADIRLDVTTLDKGRPETKVFETRVYLINRDRYRYD